MHEDLLQFVWKEGFFNASNLQTTDGQEVSITYRGDHNLVAGPDFSEAKIKIGETTWAGSVEIHTRSSEWNAHNHQSDEAYNNVILHAVYEHNSEIQNEKGDTLPTIELKGRIASSLLAKYEYLKSTKNKIPCADHFASFPSIKFQLWLQRILVSRLERKSEEIALIHKYSEGDWLQTFYVLLAGYFGQNHNKLPFQEMARKMPLSTLSKHVNQPNQLEAMMFGVAGLLEKPNESAYSEQLRKEFSFLSNKHHLQKITQAWKFGGIRPEAFPTRRMALLCAIVPSLQKIQAEVLAGKSVTNELLSVTPNPFWDHHFTFHKTLQNAKPLNLSEGFLQTLQINVISPYLFYYGQTVGDDNLKEFAIDQLQKVKAEENQFIRAWDELGYQPKSAADSQALIELTTQFCKPKNCVFCNVGKSIISHT